MGFDIFFGSKDQDKWVVKEIFKNKRNGFFVDLAATNGFHQNNTYFLEKNLIGKESALNQIKIFIKS